MLLLTQSTGLANLRMLPYVSCHRRLPSFESSLWTCERTKLCQSTRSEEVLLSLSERSMRGVAMTPDSTAEMGSTPSKKTLSRQRNHRRTVHLLYEGNGHGLGRRGTTPFDESGAPSSKRLSSEKSADQVDSIEPSASAVSSELSTNKAIDAESTDGREIIEKKRKWFQKMFSKNSKQKENATIASNDHEIVEDASEDASEDEDSNGTSAKPAKGKMRKSYPPVTSVDAAAAAAANAPIVINQNWFARFFHIKPASRVICLQIGKGRARKELVRTLREWRKYGLRDVVCERRSGGDVVRGRVDACNCESNLLRRPAMMLTTRQTFR